MIIPDFVTQIKEMIVKGDKRYPCYSNRASSIGYFVPELEGCLRRGVYERTNWQDKEAYNSNSLLRFKEGNSQETILLNDLSVSGIQVIEQQSSFVWEKYQISGHLDGVIVIDGKSVPIEIKSMAPNIFSGIKTLEDFKKKPWTKAYLAQIQIYMLFKNIDTAIFFLKDKSSGDLKQINVELDYEIAESCVKTAEIINNHVDTKTLPERITNIDKCKECPFKLLCLPGLNFGTELKIEQDTEFELKLDKYLSIASISSECEKLWEVIKNRAKASATVDGNLNIIVGKYRLTAKSGKQFRLIIDKI